MKMLKKFAVVLLLSGSCGLQAMHGLGEPEINSSDHVQANPHMYHYDDDGINMSSIRYELKDEYKPENIARARAAKEEARLAEEALADKLAIQAGRERISVAQLKSELYEARLRPNGQDGNDNYTYPTFEEALIARERMNAQREADIARRLKMLDEMNFARANRTPEQIAAEKAEMDLYTRRREFEEARPLRFPDQYKLVEDPNLGMYGPVPDHYEIKPEYRKVFEAELAAIK